MKRLASTAAAILIAAACLPSAASAQRGHSINRQQANIEHRINVGVRNGQLTRSEARRLRANFRQIQRLEYRYRRSGRGLSAWERRDLNNRLHWLSRQLRWDRHDWQRRWR